MDARTAVARLGQGQFLEDLYAALTTVAEDVVRTSNKGKVTVTFDIARSGDGAVTILEQLKLAPPTRRPN